MLPGSNLIKCVVAFMLAAAPYVSAQESPGEVSGRVVSSSGNEPLALVDITLVDTSFQTVTGDDGTFRITGVPAGAYRLQAATVGYYPLRQGFTLAAAETKTFDVVLISSTGRRTDTVDVSADVFGVATQTSASGFTLEGAERKNAASVLADDPLRAVQSLPGVTSNRPPHISGTSIPST
jgi:hypothetical protein